MKKGTIYKETMKTGSEEKKPNYMDWEKTLNSRKQRKPRKNLTANHAKYANLFPK